MTLIEAISDYHSYQEARGDSLSHQKECTRILQSLANHVGEQPLGDVTAEQIRSYIGAIRMRRGVKGRQQVSDLTVFAYYRTLAAFFRYLETHELIVGNPMKRVPKPRIGDYLIQPFSDEQIKKLLAQPDVTTFTGLRDCTLMCFLLDTGCRISECLMLTLDDLDVPRRVARVLGKGKRQRDVPYGVHTAAWLECYLERRRKSVTTDLVFVNEYGERLTRHAASRRIAAYGRQAGLRGVRVSPHTFRHTFGVNWLLGDGEYKGDALSLQRILGHSTSAMTQRYVHFTSQDLGKLHTRLSPANRLVQQPPNRRHRI